MAAEKGEADASMGATAIERREKIIRVGIGIIVVGSAAGWLFGLLLSAGQDVAGAAIAQALGVLSAGVIAVPAGLVVAWAAWRPWRHLNRRYKILVVLIWLLVLTPVAAALITLAVTLLQPMEPTYLDLPR